MQSLWPLVVYFAIVLIIVAVMIGLSYLLGGRHVGPTTGMPYESGLFPTGSAHLRFDARFYLVAMFFVVFDMEAAFLFAWAVALRQAGWTGYFEALIFIAVLMAALLYLWRVGALDWGTRRRTPRRPANGKQAAR